MYLVSNSADQREYFLSDFVLEVKANPGPNAPSITSSAEVGGSYGYLDEDDVNSTNKGAAAPQIPAAHEFGHLMGLNHPGADPARPQRGEYGADYDALIGGGAGMRAEYYESWRQRLSDKYDVNFKTKIG